MNISAWAIQRPIPIILLFLILTLMGAASFGSLGVDENPNLDIPYVTVSIAQTGAAPSELESQVARRVEDAVAGLAGVKHATTTVIEGVSLTTIEFELGTNTDRAVNDVRDAVTRVRGQMPGGISEPVISRLDIAGGAMATYTVSSRTLDAAELSWRVDDAVSRELMAVPGVGQVQRSGGVDREIRIELDPAKLEAMGVTPDVVNAQLRMTNVNLPGGRSDLGTTETSIRTLGSAETLEALRATRISLPNGSWARLDTLGSVTDTAADPRQMAFLDGKPVVAFSIMRTSGSNIAQVDEEVEHRVEELGREMGDVEFTKIRTNAKFVEESYHATVEHLLLGAALAVAVIWFFLRDWRASAISALAMPLSMIPTFTVMQLLGFTLNNMSLLALALVIGILVDDAIVEVENIVRHMQMGKKPYQAALEAADEIGLAVMATTLTIIVVFVPVSFMGGIPGQFFKQFGLTVAVSVFFSLLVARLLTPLMAAYWLKHAPHEESRGLGVLLYEKTLAWAMRHRVATVVLAVLFFVAGIGMAAAIPTNLMAAVDRGETIVNVQLAPGAQLEETARAVGDVSATLQARPEVDKVFAVIGTPATAGRPSAGAVNKATVYAVLVGRSERSLSQQEFEESVRPALREVPGVLLTMGEGGMSSGRLQILFSGQDAEALESFSERVMAEMRTLPGLTDVNSGAALQRPEIRVIPDEARAAEQGVSIQAIARTAMIATMGDSDANLARFDLGDRQLPIRIQLDPAWRNDLERLGELKVQSSTGRLIPLRNVARLEVGAGPSQINRYDRKRQVTLEATMLPGTTLSQAMEAVHALPSMQAMPEGIQESPAGDAEIQAEVFAGFAWAMAAAVVLIYAVLVLLFGDFLQPLTIMVSLPLSLGGAMGALLLTKQALGLYPLIGILMLMGLVTKNAILLVEYCLREQKEGMPRNEAIVKAGEARMRPILMTTVAMIVGMIPIALGIGAGAEARAGMAIAVIGGLITSTVLTLVVVPVVYTLVEDFGGWMRRRGTPRAQASAGLPVGRKQAPV